MNEQHPDERNNDPQEPIVRDKRRIDPETGRVREQGSEAEELEEISQEDLNSLLEEAMGAAAVTDSEQPPADPAADAELSDTENPYLDDLKRVHAEYANYRRRTEREKNDLEADTTAKVVARLLPVLDDLDRAAAAGDLGEGTPMQVIANKLQNVIARLGVERYGEPGEPFDPKQHEAIAQLPNPEVTSATIADVVEVGYRIGEREVRAAKVAVFVPAE